MRVGFHGHLRVWLLSILISSSFGVAIVWILRVLFAISGVVWTYTAIATIEGLAAVTVPVILTDTEVELMRFMPFSAILEGIVVSATSVSVQLVLITSIFNLPFDLRAVLVCYGASAFVLVMYVASKIRADDDPTNILAPSPKSGLLRAFGESSV